MINVPTGVLLAVAIVICFFSVLNWLATKLEKRLAQQDYQQRKIDLRTAAERARAEKEERQRLADLFREACWNPEFLCRCNAASATHVHLFNHVPVAPGTKESTAVESETFVAIDGTVRKTSKKSVYPVTDFASFTQCPGCGQPYTHPIDSFTKSHIFRTCINEECGRRWRQNK